ncbi:pectin lyase-like protein [Rickenella mellea]|uniref:Pectinesterase n=1 Tax=Rickenella mellea TaxID=50990 RepID=A0A4Y7Q0H2_9AGAM|nr:pectin lyase-like protein [Rickenella mellea]
MLSIFSFVSVLALCFALPGACQTRTKAPSGAVVVRPSNPGSGEFTSVAAAINSLPNDSSSRTIFIFPGTYSGQVTINRSGPVTVYGYTSNVQDFNSNQVVLTHSASLGTAGSDDLSGTLRILSNNVKIYNIDIKNTFGVAQTNGQAIALSNYGSRVGIYASRMYSYQDTLYTNKGTHVYLKSYIEGAVDFIFGRLSQAYFEGNTIASKGYGCVTASGRQSNDAGIYLFNNNKIIKASDAFSNVTGDVWLGRPWGSESNFVVANRSQLNKAVWSVWNTATPNTDHVTFAEYNSTGSGVAGVSRPSFSTLLTSSQAAQYTIASAIGSDYISWVDASYLS